MNSEINNLDALDFEILNSLLEDARTPFLEIARKCNVSGGTIHVRVKKMEDMGLIKGSKLLIDNSKFGYEICCFIGIYLDKPSSYNKVLHELYGLTEIVELHTTTGKYSLFLKAICKNIPCLQLFILDKLYKIEGIHNLDTFISLNQNIDRNIKL